MKKIISVFLMLILLVFTLCACDTDTEIIQLKEKPTGDLNVHFIDVGQGDCTLLESSGKYTLIDGGEKDYEDVVCNYLKSYGVSTIDYVIATHPHSDHCGSLTKVINTFDCKNFITTETDQQTPTWLNVLNAVDENNVNYIDAKVGSTYTLGKTTLQILGPISDYYDDYNNYSVIVKATCEDNSFLFMGDAERLSENELLQSGADLSADVLRVGHHGSHSSTSSSFLSSVSPRFAIISCGRNNDYGHPHKEVINELSTRDITIYRTDQYQNIIASSNGNDITFYYDSDNVIQGVNSLQTSDVATYIGNKNSKKFHLSDCGSVTNMKDENKVSFDSRQQAIDNGYTPCQSCNP